MKSSIIARAFTIWHTEQKKEGSKGKSLAIKFLNDVEW